MSRRRSESGRVGPRALRVTGANDAATCRRRARKQERARGASASSTCSRHHPLDTPPLELVLAGRTTEQDRMASINAVTRQIAALEISSKPNTQGSTAARGAGTGAGTGTHQKKPSQSGTNVARLLFKFAPPSTTTSTAGGSKPSTAATTVKHRPASPTKIAPPAPTPAPTAHKTHAVDIGRYDGGLELDDEQRGTKVTGAAAEELALDSSVAR